MARPYSLVAPRSSVLERMFCTLVPPINPTSDEKVSCVYVERIRLLDDKIIIWIKVKS